MAEQRSAWRAGEMGKRPVRIANCSGYHGDPAREMYKQATLGDIDFITGDYLAEVNMAGNAQAYASGEHPGYEETAWEGLQQTIDVIAQKQIKVAINGGALNPRGLATKVAELVKSKGYNLTVAYISGDNILPQIGKYMPSQPEQALPHLESQNSRVTLGPETFLFAQNTKEPREIVAANAYLGAHSIYEALSHGADIVICGRASDASPVIGCAWYWWSWHSTEYDALAGALIAGHLIECSAYVTGGNFAGFDAFDMERFIEPGFPIAEIHDDGTCVITKHVGTGGMVTVDTCRSQFLYELQGNEYLNSDVTAILDDVMMEQVGDNRVHVSGIRGVPPPATTKLAVFYKGGYEVQALFNATGYAYDRKFDLLHAQLKHFLGDEALKKFDIFEMQKLGIPATNPSNQNSSTCYFRLFAQSTELGALKAIGQAMRDISLRHFSGFHSFMDPRISVPRPYLAYYPALWPQSKIQEQVNFVDLVNGGSTSTISSFTTTQPPAFRDLLERKSYDTTSPIDLCASASAGELQPVRLGDIALGRSGDKGANLNFALFVHTPAAWDWLRSYLSTAKALEMLSEEWQSHFSIERVEFPHIRAVHFVVYGILGRGVSSSKRLDGFGKGFVDYFRDKIVEVPNDILKERVPERRTD